MINRSTITLLLLLFAFGLRGQTLNKGEYFFDSDPGTGSGTPLTFSASASINTNFAININALSTGFHNLNIRLRDNTGKWSHFQSRTFYLAPLASLTPPAVNVVKAEYFFDSDPGQGSATNIPITTGATLNQNIVVPITSLATGFHNLNFRVKDDKGKWSHFATRTFYIVPPLTGTTGVTIAKAEYFFDSDPGNGAGTSVPVTPAGQINQNIVVPIGALSPGFHTLNFRARDDKGKWSHFATRTFYIVATPPPAVTSLRKAEYFFDTDPGTGNATPLTITAGNQQDNLFALDVNALPTGFHRLGIRYQDNQGRWSHFSARTFYLMPGSALGGNIVRAEYFIDTDPDVNPSATGTSLTVTPAPSIDQSYAIDLSGTPAGAHTLYVRVKDSAGYWSTRVKSSFTVLSCTPPAAPLAPGANRCGVGSVVLTATGGTGAQQYRWYDDASTSTILFTGASFITPTLANTRNYFVSIYDPNTLCESNRTSTPATINFATPPVVNPSGTLSLCEGNSVILSAPSGFTQYVWSNGETTRQVLVNTSGKYTVQVGDGTCQGPASDTVYVSVVPAPAKPTITITGNTTVCGSGSVQLAGPAGFEYTWSTGATTQSITVSQTGVYFLTVKTAGSCPSLPSDPIAFTILTPPCNGGGGTNQSPVINNNPLASTIEGILTLDLTTIVSDPDNNLDFATLKLVNTTTARGAIASIDASYNLVVDYSGLPFTGTDRITLEVCDLAGACVQQVIDIEVVGAVVVYNGVTPDGDGKNDYLLIKYIDVIEGADKNKVAILNRWGDVVFNISNYNNQDRVFAGLTNNGSELPSGTYYYKIEFSNGIETLTGYLTLIR